ncbi:NAD(P)-dependent oxidoreductase [Gordonia sp. CPCC 206044]|uniref:NAD(P)-dependent oxidoreductase n=1 Tax=Gordonia sp. CPCC 206044 TaxID=3140793 RepID=UPI003AF3A1BE
MTSAPLPHSHVGMIGLGAMGAPIATNFVDAGQVIRVADASDAALQRFLDAHPGGAQPGGLESCDVVVLSLPTSDIVDEVLCGDDGLLARLRPGSTVIDMSSSVPTRTQAVARVAANHDVAVLDAPVSGGVARARNGDLAVMVGGERAVLDAVEPLLATTAREIIHVGAVGTGHAAKALNNLLSAIGLYAAAEILVVGKKFGIDSATLLSVLNAGSGRNQATETKFEKFVLSRAFDSGFTAALMDKDIGIALELANACGVDLEVGSALGAAWSAALGTLDGRADQTEIVRAVEARADVEVR